MTASPKVFISYSHDSQAHKDFVQSLADQLRADGIDALIDQYLNGSPREGWIKWMEQQIETADFVLLMCTPVYLQRYRGQDLASGRGVNFEGVVISQILYDAFQRNDKFIPVIPHEGSLDHVPLPLKAYNCYRLPDDYDNLYRHLTNQPTYILPLIGYKKILPSLNNITTGTINKIKYPNLNTLVVDNADKSSCNHEKNLDTNPNIINLSFTSDYQSKVKPYLEKIFLESNNNLKQINQSLKLLAILALFSTTYWVAEKENIFIEVDITNKTIKLSRFEKIKTTNINQNSLKHNKKEITSKTNKSIELKKAINSYFYFLSNRRPDRAWSMIKKIKAKRITYEKYKIFWLRNSRIEWHIEEILETSNTGHAIIRLIFLSNNKIMRIKLNFKKENKNIKLKNFGYWQIIDEKEI